MAFRLRDRVDAVVERRDIDQVQQQLGSLKVPQELVSEAPAFGGPFDESGHVGDDEALLVRHAHYAQVGMKRREGVVRNLGTRVEMAESESTFQHSACRAGRHRPTPAIPA